MKKFRRHALLFSVFSWLAFTCEGLQAETYKCMHQGATTYSQTPCEVGTSKLVQQKIDEVPEQAYQQALKQNAQDEVRVKKMQDARHKSEAKYEREMKAIALKNENKKQQCDALQAKVKWAKEDLAASGARTETKAKLKLKRASENLTLNCKVD